MKDKISIIFVGTGEFGIPVLQKLKQDKHFHIPFIITVPDKPSGRGLKSKASPIKNAALLNKLIVHTPSKIEEMKQKLIQEKPDFLLVVSYGEIIPKEILEIPEIAPINIHASLLPKYRGASPIQEALLNGDKETGITWIFMTEKMDAGDIIKQTSLSISVEDNFPTLSRKLSHLAAEKTHYVLCHGFDRLTMTQQDENLVTYCKKMKKSDGLLDPEKETAEEMLRKIRAYTPWPGTYLFFKKKHIKIIRAEISEQKISTGKMKVLNGKILAIGTRKGTLLPIRIQPESKREMGIEEFLRGQNILS